MSEDTKLQQLIINTLSPEQFEPITPSDTEIYLVEDDAEYATVEELATKQDVINDLGDIRNNIATNTSNISYLDEKVRDIELFKFPNAVIIGEPTISNGQVSGFSADNYMQFPFILDLHNTPFQIDFAFTTGNNVTTQQNILDSEFGLALAIANGKGLMAISGNGTSWNIGSSVGTIAIQPNTTYYARLTWDGMQYKTLISTNGTDYTQDMYLVGTQRPYPRTIFIGGCSGSVIGHTPHPFFGTINMNKAYLSTRGQVIWQGMDDAGLVTRADISLSNLDELGEKRFTDKQDVISDLDTIRAGASKGATAIQQVKTINGESIVGSGNITIKSAPDLDDVTISKNSNDELQAIALVEDDKTYKPTDFAKADELNNPYSLFDCKFADHLLENASWLRADEFNWYSGDVYIDAYNHLVSDYSEAVPVETDTINGITIYYKRSADGHKVCHHNQEQNALDIYNSTGIAWYYILDTENKRFKLPRTKWGFKGLRDRIGDGIIESLPSHTHDEYFVFSAGARPISPLYNTSGSDGTVKSLTQNLPTINNVSDGVLQTGKPSSSTYKDNAPVQERGTQMYLYFYVGETVQNANLIDVGRIEETKVNKSGDTMTGDLHFNRSYLDTTIVPTSNIYSTPIGIYDKNNVLTGYIQTTQRSNGQIITGINAHKIVDGTDKYTSISVGFDSSGNAFCEFPNTKNVDGQWVHSRKILLDNVTISAKTEVDLSTYLPTNNFNYDVMFSFVASTDNTSGHWYQAMITSDIITEDVIIAACTRAGAVQTNGGCAIIPISTSRKVYISKLGTSNMLGAYFIVNAYRRIGTNG